MKPLYVQGREGLRVVLDGGALRVDRPATAAVFYPLSRVSRVVASGPVEVSTGALLACAERGIAVSFLRRDGHLVAYLFGESRDREGLMGRLSDLLDRSDWRDRYGDWLAANESLARRSLARRLGVAPGRLARDRGAVLLAGARRRRAPAVVCRRVERRLEGLLAGLVAELLAEAGLGADQARVLDEGPDLAGDLRRLLAWDLHLPVLRALEQGWVEDAALVALFEGRVGRLRSLGRSVLNRLHRWLVELS